MLRLSYNPRLRIRMRLWQWLPALCVAAGIGVHARSRAAQLPQPCLAGSCGATGPASFVTSGTASAVQAGAALTVQQSSTKAILNWKTFNLSADATVKFQQPTATSIALNRIFDANPSTILGSISANGQIYLINPNGFVFGATAQVNTAGLIAASLGISDSTFSAGLLAPQVLFNRQAALTSDPAVLAANGTPTLDGNGNPVPGAVIVQQGAQISASSGGRILLAAPTVQNAGTLQASDGQVVLAAGQKVYLQASASPELRGLIVEVDQGGTAWNQLTGAINTPRGNVSMVGLMVNQDGRLSATTTVAANGSIRLEASDTTTSFPANAGSNSVPIVSSHGGTVELGARSSMDIEPELADIATAVDDQPQLQSSVTILGQQVLIHGGTIKAPAGTLTVIAAADPGSGTQNVQDQGNTNARVRIDPGTTIDLSGSVAELPMAANLVTLQLRANELADDPSQRDGALRGDTVTIDARVGTPIADVKSAIAAVPKSVAQRTEHGGSALIESEGDIVVAQGASIDVSGGQTQYDGGIIQTTQLVGANGRLYDIGTANPLMSYTGVVNPTFTESFDRWGVQSVVPTPGLGHFEPGYVQGAGAGSVTFASPAMALSGALQGRAVNGPYQRSSATMVAGGALTIGVAGGLQSGAAATDFLSPPIVLSGQLVPVSVADDVALTPGPLYLPASYLSTGGFTDTMLYGNSQVTLAASVPLQLLPGSLLSIQAPRIDLLSSITDPAGNVNLQSVLTLDAQDPALGRTGVTLGSGVTIDVRGLWTNDSPQLGVQSATAPTLPNGGTISLGLNTILGGQLVLGNGVSLRASGGAWVNSANKVSGGAGGSIVLQAGPGGSALQVGTAVSLDAFGVGTAAGGSLALTAPRLRISNGAHWAGAEVVDDIAAPGSVLDLYTALFTDYGFSTVTLGASGFLSSAATPTDALRVVSGTSITALTRSLALDSGYLLRASGGNIADFSRPVTLGLPARSPEHLNFRVAPTIASPGFPFAIGVQDVGLLDVQSGASITTDPGGSINLAGVGGILVHGALRAPAGTITLETPTPGISDLDPGYLADLRLDLGADAALDVSGTVQFTPNSAGLRLGSVLAGGSVNLYADRGSVVTQAGSQINLSGATALLDIQSATEPGGYARQAVASAGGTLTIRAPESIALQGGIQAAAGTGGIAQPQSGSVEIDLTRARNWFSAGDQVAGTFPQSPRVVTLATSSSGAALALPVEGQAVVGVADLLGSGIDSLRLEAGDGAALDTSSIVLATSTPIALARQLILDAPVIAVGTGIDASLRAPYVALGDSLASGNSPTPGGGTGTLRVDAEQITLLGATVLQGVGSATLASSGDLLLRGAAAGGDQQSGALLSAGNLELDAERIYPASGTAFAIVASGAGHTIDIGQTGIDPGTPLSAGGSISIRADTIVSSGTLVAPFGTIDLNAATTLTLGHGSITSVSADGAIIPYGNTALGGVQWVYGSQLGAVPVRDVTLGGSAVTVAAGATVDLQGGGDLYAYEWVPGTGGSIDALASNAVPGLYAVLPSMLGQFAPYDPIAWAGSTLTPGASISLGAGSGLTAGVYPLLPARYGLLPGARLVQVQPGFQDILPGQQATLGNGTPVVAGFFTSGNTGLQNAAYSGVAVWPSAYARQIAGYQDSYASTFFTGAHTRDAGSLSIDVGAALTLAGSALTAAASGGQPARIGISAAQLEVTAPGATATPGFVDLPAAVIDSWNAGELVLGGSAASDDSQITVTADRVTLGAGVQLSAGQVVLVANELIDLQPGALLRSNPASSGTASPATLPVANVTLAGSGAGGAALLSVSDESLLLVQRPSAAGGSGNAGVVQLEGGAALNSSGGLSLDAPGGATLAGSMNLSGASVSLGAPSIGLLAPSAGAAVSADALQIDATLVSALQQAGALRLASQGAIDLYAPLSLGAASAIGTPSLAALTLIGTSLNNRSGSAIVLGAQTVTLEGEGSAISQVPLPASGSLTVVAGSVNLGPGALSVNGFTQTAVLASGAVVGQGAGTLQLGGDASISAAELTAAAGSQMTLSVPGGTLTVNPAAAMTGAANSQVLPVDIGGALTLSAAQILENGAISLPSGLIALQASGNLFIGASAALHAGGVTLSVGSQSTGSPGGAISLTSGSDIVAQSGSVIDVAGAGGAPAGALSVIGAGTVTLQSTLQGSAQGSSDSSSTGGSVTVQAGLLGSDLNTLAAGIQAGRFTNQITLRVHSGDLDLGATGVLSANQVTLTADTGRVQLDGVISAPSGAQRGQISVFGGTGVVLGAGAQLHADSGPTNGSGGAIELGTGPGGIINLVAGSVVSTSGSAQSGTLLLRASATAAGDVGVVGLNGDLSSVGQILIEPVLAIAASGSLSAGDFAGAQSTLGVYMDTAATAIPGRLNPAGTLPLAVMPGIEFDAAGALTLTSALDLSSWRYGGEPVDLTVRAGGALTINGSISDGFVPVTTALLKPGITLGAGPSASVRLIAGADLGSADPLALAASSNADLTLSPSVIVRTGTGDIDLFAARDIVLGAGSSVYTAGTPAASRILVTKTNSMFNFPTDGGALLVAAGRNVIGAPVSQSISAWQIREGNTGTRPQSAQWGVDLAQFGWNFGTLGGGDLRITAGSDVRYVSAAAADSRIVSNNVGQLLPGGALEVTAGGDVGSGQFYAADGVATLTAGGAFSAIEAVASGSGISYVGSLIALNDAQVSLQSRLDITIDAVVNPTTLAQALPSATQARSQLASSYFSYGADSSLTLLSTAGSISLQNNVNNLTALMGGLAATGFGGEAGQAYPATLIAHALQQDINLIGGGATLFPSDQGQLQLLAGVDINDDGATLVMSDAFASALPTPAAPGLGNGFSLSVLPAFASGRHAQDPVPAEISAGRDITGLVLSVPKQAQITAGRDISNLTFTGQNLNRSDLTLIAAGRDFSDSLNDAQGIVQLGGPGSLDVLAGRDVNLGVSEGITTVGNLSNANLSTAAGSDVTVLAGLGAALSADQPLAPAEQAFFAALSASGIAANTVPGAGFTQGYAAIDALFPNSRTAALAPGAVDPYRGDLTLTFSRIYTLSGGTIALLVPGGEVNVGLATVPPGLPARQPSQLGIVAQGAGDVNIYSKGDINVNASRIFTLGGGNILIWSDEGSIDAGRGSKSSISAPAPQVTFDALGNVTLNLAGAVAGSGIRTIQIDPDVSAGNVDLIAPEGTVNAGDAGIGAAGNINIAALQVIGLNNIQFGGSATGVPAQVGNLGASLSGVAAVASSATSSSSGAAEAERNSREAAVAPLAQAALSWLDVFVTGLGEENCRPDDLECLKRQKTN